MNRQVNYPHLGVSAFVLLLSATLAIGAALLPVDKGYSVVGTNIFPYAVSLLMAVVGLGLAWQSVNGGFMFLDQSGEDEAASANPERLKAVAWVSAGLLQEAILIGSIGFVFASTLLFMSVAQGFGSRNWKKNALIGLALTWPIYIAFSKGLGLTLPGLFKPWI
jgi:putative tricarboxylic transport membrane protein